jgi:SAM-dependent methyltransferase
LPFPDASFDLVNAREIIGFTRTDQWVPLLRECIRILKPGGVVRFTEAEVSNTNKPHIEKTLLTGFQAMNRAGMIFSPQGIALNIIPMLPGFFRDAGLERIGKMAHVIDFSENSDTRDALCQDMETAFPLIGPFLEKMGIITQQAWNELYQQALLEVYDEDFRNMWFILTVWGYKPIPM